MSGILALETERLKMYIGKDIDADDPRCLRCRIVSPSGPVALEFLLCVFFVAVSLAVNGV